MRKEKVMEIKEKTLKDVRREMVDRINSIHAKLDIIASVTAAGDEAEVSLRSIRQLSSEGLANVEELMDLWGEQERLIEIAK
jgi:regulator of sigma D